MASNGNSPIIVGPGQGMSSGGVILPSGTNLMSGQPQLTDEQADQWRKAMAAPQGPTLRQQSSLLIQWDRILNLVGPNPFDNTRLSYDQMYQMRKDGVIAFGLHTLEVPILLAEWYIKCARADVASFIDNSLRQIWPRFVLAMLNSLRFGHSPLVKRFGLANPDWTYFDPSAAEGEEEQPVWDNGPVQALIWKQPVALAPEKCWPKWTTDGEFAGIRYSGNIRLPGAMIVDSITEGPSQTDVDLQHSLWVINEQDAHFDAIWGYPRTGYAWKPFWAYEYLWALANRFFEKHADPPMVGYHPDGYVEEASGDIVHRADRMLSIMGTMRSGSNVALPSDMVTSEFANTERMSVRREWEIEQLEPKGNPEWFNNRFTALNIEKLRGLWIAEQSVIPGESGQSSRNVAATLNEGTDDAAAFLCMMLDHVVNHYVIPDLVRANFPDFDGECKKITRGFAQDDVTLARQVIQAFGQMDPLSLPVDVTELLKTLGLPILTGKALQERNDQYIEQAHKLQPPMVPPGQEGGEEAGTAPAGDGGGLAPGENGKELAAAIADGKVKMTYVKAREKINLSDVEIDWAPTVIFCSELPAEAPPGVAACQVEGQVYALDTVPSDVAEKYASLFTNGIELSATTAMKAATPKPLGKPGGPGLWHHKGEELPHHVQWVAHALMRDHGMDESHAIAIAVSAEKKWAAGGKSGGEKGNIKPEVRAAAAKSVGEWETKKAEAKAHKLTHAIHAAGGVGDKEAVA